MDRWFVLSTIALVLTTTTYGNEHRSALRMDTGCPSPQSMTY